MSIMRRNRIAGGREMRIGKEQGEDEKQPGRRNRLTAAAIAGGNRRRHTAADFCYNTWEFHKKSGFSAKSI